ncbi:MAG TPA: metallophosphoesterase [Thermoleophilaceae bacterium]|nr:metallophosphoesterase [Thermoleophilaceae bacterium]
MLAAVVSDLHLGIQTGADLLRRPGVRERLFEAIAEADEVVLLGDSIELRDGSLAKSLTRALPFFEALGAALAGRRLTIVPGNHDHRLVEDALKRSPSLELAGRFEVLPADAVAPIMRSLGSTSATLAYPGVWLREDVYATHGHYLDCHSEARTFECRARAAVERVRRLDHGGYTSPGDYEAALGPVYRMIQWSVQPPGVRAAAHAARRVVRRWERPRAPLGARAELGLPAMEQVVHSLGIGAPYVLFGHLHAPGRWSTQGGTELINAGSWVEDATSVSPGTCVLVPDEGPPRLKSLL